MLLSRVCREHQHGQANKRILVQRNPRVAVVSMSYHTIPKCAVVSRRFPITHAQTRYLRNGTFPPVRRSRRKNSAQERAPISYTAIPAVSIRRGSRSRSGTRQIETSWADELRRTLRRHGAQRQGLPGRRMRCQARFHACRTFACCKTSTASTRGATRHTGHTR